MSPDLETHRQLAAVAWRRRHDLLERMLTRDTPLLVAEWNLAAHLHLLSTAPGGEPGDRPGQTFTWLASHLASGDDACVRKALELVVDSLSGDSGLPREVYDALVLYPSDAADTWLCSLFEARPELRPDIVSIWRDRQAELPPEVQSLSESELGSDTPLGAALVSYHAHVAHGNIDVLEACYRPLLHGGRVDVLPSFVPDALWGTAVRGDVQALEALDRALASAAGENAAELLRVAAWTGDPRFVDRLKSAGGRHGGREWYWMAVHGDSRFVPMFIETMANPKQNDQIREAWILLTGHDPSRRPRLRVVSSDKEAAGPPAEAGGEIVDVEQLHHWWQGQQWVPGQRYLAGEPVTPRFLSDLAGTFAGQLGEDLIRATEFVHGAPLKVSIAGWRRNVRAALSRIPPPGASPRQASGGTGA